MYYIQIEKDKGEGPNRVLIRSISRTCCKNLGMDTEYVKDDPEYSDFFLSELCDIEHADHDDDLMMDPVRGEDESQIEVIDPEEPDAHQTEQERRDR
jgi:hypothetical protein